MAFEKFNYICFITIMLLTFGICSYNIPLVADIHFAPSVALRVAECFDKIRVNPGNFGTLFGIQSFNISTIQRQHSGFILSGLMQLTDELSLRS